MLPPRPTDLAHQLVGQTLRAGDLAIDATVGNGHDTLMLAERVGESGRVLAFDVQAAAIEAARARIVAAGFDRRVEFHHASHARMAETVAPAAAAAIMFNLGYLPGGDHRLTTHAEETTRALDAAASCMKPGALLTIVCYPGHAAGATEAAAVESMLTAWSVAGWRVAKYAMLGTRSPAPFLIAASSPPRPAPAPSEFS
jgi:tRNA1(Val) A37 N6-methylase TrmN6